MELLHIFELFPLHANSMGRFIYSLRSRSISLVKGLRALQFDVAHIKNTERGPAHGARALLLQPNLFFVLILTRCKPFGHAIDAPHGPTIAIATSRFSITERLPIVVHIQALFLQFDIRFGLHACEA